MSSGGVAGEDEHVAVEPVEAARAAADGVAGAARLSCTATVDALERVRASRARRRRRAGRRRAGGRPRSPSRPAAGRAAGAGAWASPSACACRGRRPGRRLRGRCLVTGEMAGAPGFEPGIAGPKPAALPLGYAPPQFVLRQVGPDGRASRRPLGRRRKRRLSTWLAHDSANGQRQAMSAVSRRAGTERRRRERAREPAN